MTPLDDFLPRLLPYVPGCPDPVAKQALVDAAILFCERSLAIRERMDPFTVVAGQSDYDVDTPQQQEIARILEVWVGGVRLSGVPEDQVDWDSTNPSSPTVYSVPQVDGARVLRLAPTPSEGATGNVEFALRPTRAATALHDELFGYWIEPVVTLARSLLYSMPGQTFSTDLATAEAYERKGWAQAAGARAESNLGRVRGSMRVRPRNFV